MAIPGDPSVEDIILHGMKEGGQYTVSAGGTAYAEFRSYQFESLKSEMWAACKTDRFLETDAVMLTSIGNSNVTLPTDFDSEISVTLYDADDGYRGTAQAGASNSITLATDFESVAELLYGAYLFILSGTGAGQMRQITGYDDSTKVANVHSAWTVAPDNTSGYMVATMDSPLRRADYLRIVRTAERPGYYGKTGVTMQVTPVPNKIYPIIIVYRSNLTRLDDAGSLFVKHLRERRSLWVQGVKTKTMARYDDERHPQNKMIWDQMLMQYAAENAVYDQMEPHR